MKVYFDVVINHTADVITYDEGDELPYRNKTDVPYRDADGHRVRRPRLRRRRHVPAARPGDELPVHADVYDPPSDATAKVPAWLNDRTLYHNRGNSTFSGENSLYGDFFGLDDLFTEHPTVVDGMIDIHTSMIDDVRHRRLPRRHRQARQRRAVGASSCPPSRRSPRRRASRTSRSSARCSTATRRSCRASRPSCRSPRRSTSGSTARCVDTVAGAAADRPAARRCSPTTTGSPTPTPTPSSSPSSSATTTSAGIGRSIVTATPARPTTELVARARLAQVLNFTTRGTPVVYYGDEQGFTGDGGDQDARQDMFDSQVASVPRRRPDRHRRRTWPATTSTRRHPLYQAISELAALRADHVALRQGAQLHRYSEGGAGHLRLQPHRHRRRRRRVRRRRQQRAKPPTRRRSAPTRRTRRSPRCSGGGAPITSSADGTITVERARRSTPSSTAPAAQIGSDTERRRDRRHRHRRPVPRSPAACVCGADVGGGDFAEVTFAVSVDGGALRGDRRRRQRPVRRVPRRRPASRSATSCATGRSSPTSPATSTPPAPPPSSARRNRPARHRRRQVRGRPLPARRRRLRRSIVRRLQRLLGLHAWGDIVATVDWTDPRPLHRRGRLRPLRLGRAAARRPEHGLDRPPRRHQGRHHRRTASSTRRATPEVWLKSGDADDLHVAGGGRRLRHDPLPPRRRRLRRLGPAPVGRRHRLRTTRTEWTAPRPFDGIDEFGAFWRVPLGRPSTCRSTSSSTTATTRTPAPTRRSSRRSSRRRGSCPATRRSTAAAARRWTWRRSTTTARPATTATTTSPNFMDFWGLHVWAARAEPEPDVDGAGASRSRDGPVRHRVRRPAGRRGDRSWPTSSTAATRRTPARTCSSTSRSTATRCGSCRAPTRSGRTSCRSAGRPRLAATSTEQRAYWVGRRHDPVGGRR